MRGRRKEAPTPEELMRNYAVAEMKKINYAKLEEKADQERGHKIELKEDKGAGSFPSYKDEFEVMPGVKKGKE